MIKDSEFTVQRKKMVEEQLVARGISDNKVIEAFEKIPRHKFVTKEMLNYAYSDSPLPIEENQTISQPYIAALMTEYLKINDTDKVLEIGTGSGYQTAILAYLAKEVFTIERKEKLAKKSEKILNELGFNNIRIRIGDGSLGWEEESPYNKIIVTAAAPELPQPLCEQLYLSGRLIIPMASGLTQTLTLFTKESDTIKKKEICGCSFVPLIGEFAYKEN